ncbi:MAG: UDP-3-O-(3-hydroxymyristoyl)glucosamine N-acyltransferase [Verrucomicrobia bacterium]|nr:UDP-3-O-(3-hydroxymyristoyl)glucosamine N-acyltransferase [Verrucomicrobiota bacterium]
MSWPLWKLAEITGATLQGDPEYQIASVADLESATENDASFLSNPTYTPLLKKTAAGVVCVDKTTELLTGKNYLISSNPSLAFQKVAELLYGQRKPTGFNGIHPTAVIHPEAKIGPNVSVGPYAVIDAGAEIKANTIIGPFVYVGALVHVGENCLLHAHSIIREYCWLGNRVILQPGAVIGSCGFGYSTNEKGEHTKLNQIGNVIVEDDVEIGANTTIDRARFKTTRIARGTKIDNLVQIAHNVELGEHNILAAQTGIAGSTKTGRNVMMGGQVGVLGHIEIAPFTMIATRGGVGKSLTKSGKYAGSPVFSLGDHNRNQVHLRKIEEYAKRIEALEAKLASLNIK